MRKRIAAFFWDALAAPLAILAGLAHASARKCSTLAAECRGPVDLAALGPPPSPEEVAAAADAVFAYNSLRFLPDSRGVLLTLPAGWTACVAMKDPTVFAHVENLGEPSPEALAEHGITNPAGATIRISATRSPGDPTESFPRVARDGSSVHIGRRLGDTHRG